MSYASMGSWLIRSKFRLLASPVVVIAAHNMFDSKTWAETIPEDKDMKRVDFESFCSDRTARRQTCERLYMTPHNAKLIDLLVQKLDFGQFSKGTGAALLVYSPVGNGKSYVLKEFCEYTSSRTRLGQSNVLALYVSCKYLIATNESVLEYAARRLREQPETDTDSSDAAAGSKGGAGLVVDYDPEQHWNVFKHVGKAVTAALKANDRFLVLVVDDLDELYRVKAAQNRAEAQAGQGYKGLVKTLVNLNWLTGQRVGRGDDGRIAVVLVGSGCSGSTPLMLQNMADPLEYPGQTIKVQKGGMATIGLPVQPFVSVDDMSTALRTNGVADDDATRLLRLVAFYMGNTLSDLTAFLRLRDECRDNALFLDTLRTQRSKHLTTVLTKLYHRHFLGYLFYLELMERMVAKNKSVVAAVSTFNESSNRTIVNDKKVAESGEWMQDFQPLVFTEVQQAWSAACTRYDSLKYAKQLPEGQSEVVASAVDQGHCKQVLSTLCDSGLFLVTPVEFGVPYEKMCYPTSMMQLLMQ